MFMNERILIVNNEAEESFRVSCEVVKTNTRGVNDDSTSIQSNDKRVIKIHRTARTKPIVENPDNFTVFFVQSMSNREFNITSAVVNDRKFITVALEG